MLHLNVSISFTVEMKRGHLNRQCTLKLIIILNIAAYRTIYRVASAGIVVWTARKWRTQVSLEIAESLLRHRTLVGTVETGRFGLVALLKVQYDEAQGRDKRHLVLEEVRNGVEGEDRMSSRMVGMWQQ